MKRILLLTFYIMGIAVRIEGMQANQETKTKQERTSNNSTEANDDYFKIQFIKEGDYSLANMRSEATIINLKIIRETEEETKKRRRAILFKYREIAKKQGNNVDSSDDEYLEDLLACYLSGDIYDSYTKELEEATEDIVNYKILNKPESSDLIFPSQLGKYFAITIEKPCGEELLKLGKIPIQPRLIFIIGVNSNKQTLLCLPEPIDGQENRNRFLYNEQRNYECAKRIQNSTTSL